MNKENFLGNNDPKEQMIDFTLISLAGQLVGVAAELGIADRLQNQPLNIDELAVNVAADRQSLYRLMRPLVALGIFKENSNNQYELTTMSEFLLSDHKESLRYISMLNSGHMGWQPQGALFDCVKNGNSAFETIFQTDLYSHLHQNPNDDALFGKAMHNLTNIDLNNVIENFNPDNINTLVDIGSGEGGLIAGILAKNPHITAILADRVEVLETAKAKLTQQNLRKRRYLGRYFAHPMMQNRRAKRDDYKPSAVRVTQRCVP
ncbi:Multifunctional cyclase-dehydratase-3-O-methyl transferase TcmN [Piscirickettsia salmonis]|uniref:methyltransferase family protein n=2 Tax=Piscirickettsia salmonis TaxID=1238 RepID=UPI0012B99242|nr:methyltransferase [Piscirickettsia salmonis]QGP49061.1 Multifunctional cyclase-dehydratase-3-O-methyl transferase TcmN [Piscirickettsia salmonis]